MSLLFYLTFILLILIVIYYFIYQENLNQDHLFYIILNFIFLIILPQNDRNRQVFRLVNIHI